MAREFVQLLDTAGTLLFLHTRLWQLALKKVDSRTEEHGPGRPCAPSRSPQASLPLLPHSGNKDPILHRLG